jgi:NAD(P)-dependent dehydrogenase (short-subunit alcohol dehydrogenase family)
VKTIQPRAPIVQITDPAEIESIERNDWDDIIGAQIKGAWYAYKFSVERFRRRSSHREGVRND